VALEEKKKLDKQKEILANKKKREQKLQKKKERKVKML